MVHRIRRAMVELFPTQLSGIVEVDETYIGGKAKRRRVARMAILRSLRIGSTCEIDKTGVCMRLHRGQEIRDLHAPS